MTRFRANTANFPRRITSIRVGKINDSTPARVNRRSGELQINYPVWRKLDNQERELITYHEEGHVANQTPIETVADAYAFDKFVSKGGSMKKAVQTLTKNLDRNNSAHRYRMFCMLQRALMHDAKVNGNHVAAEIYNNNKAAFQDMNIEPVNDMLLSFDSDFDGFWSYGWRKQAKKAKKAAKTAIKNARAKNIESEAEARLILAKQGIWAGGASGEAGSIASGLGGLFNKNKKPGAGDAEEGGGTPQMSMQFPSPTFFPQPMYYPQPTAAAPTSQVTDLTSERSERSRNRDNDDAPAAKSNNAADGKNNTMIIAIVAVVVIILIALMLKK